MSKLVLLAFVAVMALTVAALDYANQSRRLGLSLGEMSGADYLALVELRAGLATGTDKEPTIVADAAYSLDLARADRGAGFFGLGRPIDMAAFDRSIRPAEPAGLPGGTAGFSPAATARIAVGACVTNGAFKRCRASD